MIKSAEYIEFENGFLKEAEEQGCDIPFLKGLIAEAEETQEKWAAAFDEMEQLTGDPLYKLKLANELAEVALMKAAEGEGPAFYEEGSPFMSTLQNWGKDNLGLGGTGTGMLAGGGGGALLGLILGAILKNPMLGMMLGGLGGTGLGALLGSGQFGKWFGKKTPGATPAATPEANPGDPALAKSIEDNKYNFSANSPDGSPNPLSAQNAVPPMDPMGQALGQQREQRQQALDQADASFEQNMKPQDQADPEELAMRMFAQQEADNSFAQNMRPQEQADPEMLAQQQFEDTEEAAWREKMKQYYATQRQNPATPNIGLRDIVEGGNQAADELTGTVRGGIDSASQGMARGIDSGIQNVKDVAVGTADAARSAAGAVANTATRAADAVADKGLQGMNRVSGFFNSPPMQAPQRAAQPIPAPARPIRTTPRGSPITPNVPFNKKGSFKLKLADILNAGPSMPSPAGGSMPMGPSYAASPLVPPEAQVAVPGQLATTGGTQLVPKGALPNRPVQNVF